MTRLAARIWLPLDAQAHPVPAILEYLPYRKDDCTAPGKALRDALDPNTRSSNSQLGLAGSETSGVCGVSALTKVSVVYCGR